MRLCELCPLYNQLSWNWDGQITYFICTQATSTSHFFVCFVTSLPTLSPRCIGSWQRVGLGHGISITSSKYFSLLGNKLWWVSHCAVLREEELWIVNEDSEVESRTLEDLHWFPHNGVRCKDGWTVKRILNSGQAYLQWKTSISHHPLALSLIWRAALY